MARKIDDLIDELTRGLATPGEQFKDEFLGGLPVVQWPPYIDQTATDIAAHIAIGDTDLSAENFGSEVGGLYRRGLVRTVGEESDLAAILATGVTETQLGAVTYQLNRLVYDLRGRVTDVGRAVETVVRKLVAGLDETGVIETRAGTGASGLLVDLFSDQSVAAHAGELVTAIEEVGADGLLAILDEPQLGTPLWTHQRRALSAWIAADCRGYVDMATATGKTVLGIAAIAARYGRLHPDDDIDIDSVRNDEQRGRQQVLVVAPNELLLEQWRIAFDTHLDVPPERMGGHDVGLSWGTVSFRTPNALLDQSEQQYDLVILDEVHHYASASGWGKLLRRFTGPMLALTGSLEPESTLQRQLDRQFGEPLYEYSLVDARRAGVVPDFSWTVVYADVERDISDYVDVTKRCLDGFRWFEGGVEDGSLGVEQDRPFATFDDVRRYSQTTDGSQLRSRSERFKRFSSALFARHTMEWNLSPAVDSVVDLTGRHPSEHVLVLVKDNAQVDKVASRLRDHEERTVFAADQQIDSVTLASRLRRFNAADTPTVLVGTGDLLGEGVDLPQVSVAINMATGSVNTSLIQRFGRVLRNPAGKEHAVFYNLVSVPDDPGLAPTDDGVRLLRDAAQYVEFGERFERPPTFEVVTDAVGARVRRLERAGCGTLKERWEQDIQHSERISAGERRETLKQFCVDGVLGRWGGNRSGPVIGSSSDPETEDDEVLTLNERESKVEVDDAKESEEVTPETDGTQYRPVRITARIPRRARHADIFVRSGNRQIQPLSRTDESDGEHCTVTLRFELEPGKYRLVVLGRGYGTSHQIVVD